MTRKRGVDDLRDDGVVVSDDPGKDRFAFLMACDQVHSDFVFHRPALEGLFREPAAAAQRVRDLALMRSTSPDSFPFPDPASG